MIRFFLIAYAIVCSFDASAQTIDVSPTSPVLQGDTFAIAVNGLPPRASISIVAERVMIDQGKPVRYRSTARFLADTNGTVDLRRDRPAEGSYRSADVRGLFWSMKPISDPGPVGADTGMVGLTVLLDGKKIGSRQLPFLETSPQVQTEAIAAFPGAVFARLPGTDRLPAVIVLGGSEGGSKFVRELAIHLAAHGFAALGLPYYSPAAPGRTERELQDLPGSFVDIPVDRLTSVRDWLAKRRDVDSKRIALYGVSKGAEFALIAASKFTWPAAVVAIVPSDVVWQGWGPDVQPPDGQRSSFSFAGVPLPFVPNVDFVQELDGFRTGADVRFRRPMEKGRAAFPDAAVAARIRVENFKGPMLVAGAVDDQMWPSGVMAQNITERRHEAGLKTVSLVFQDAGHMLNGTGWNPTTQYNAGPFKLGGTPEGNARAQAEVWRQALAFLRHSLDLKAVNAQLPNR